MITDYMFVAALHFMLDVVGVCAGMSQTMQLRRRCIALEDLTINRCRETLDSAERWEGEGWGVFQQDFDASTLVPRFLGVPLHNTKADFPSQASDFLQQLKKNATWDHKAQASNHQNSTLLCLSFLDWLSC